MSELTAQGPSPDLEERLLYLQNSPWFRGLEQDARDRVLHAVFFSGAREFGDLPAELQRRVEEAEAWWRAQGYAPLTYNPHPRMTMSWEEEDAAAGRAAAEARAEQQSGEGWAGL